MKVLSKATEINNLLSLKATNSITQKELVDRGAGILAAPYQQYEGGIEHTEEIELLRGLVERKAIKADAFNAQVQILQSMAGNTYGGQGFQQQVQPQQMGQATAPASQYAVQQAPKAKKPIYKRPWLWIIIVIILLIIIGAASGGGGNSEPASTPEPSSPAIAVEDNNEEPVVEEEPVIEESVEDIPEPASTGIWSLNFYVDEFRQPTDETYIANQKYFAGKFSNSATTDSLLNVTILVDIEKIGIELNEYGSSLVKNSYSRSIEYEITMRTEDDTRTSFTGEMWPGGERIIIQGEDMNNVINALSGSGNIDFYIVQADRTTTTYSFTVPSSNFSEVIQTLK